MGSSSGQITIVVTTFSIATKRLDGDEISQNYVNTQQLWQRCLRCKQASGGDTSRINVKFGVGALAR